MYRLGSPIRVNFEITDACPLACEHCYTYWGYATTGTRNAKDTSGRSVEDLQRVLEILIAARIPVITFTGGEPFARKDILYPLLERAKGAGMRVLVNTSGTMVTPTDAARLTSLGVDGLLVSLMSADESTNNELAHANSYSRSIRGIELLAKGGLAVTVNMVCTTKNYTTVRATAQVAQDAGAILFSATPMLPTPGNVMAPLLHLKPDQLRSVLMDLAWIRENQQIRVTTLDPVAHCQFNSEDREILGDLLGDRYCCAGITDCAVSPDGDLRACIMSDEVGGNLVTDGWEAAWNALAAWRAPEILPTGCRSCDLVDACGGGCRVAAKATCGNLNGPDPYMRLPIAPVPHKEPPLSQVPQLQIDTELVFHPDLISRAEPFGGTLLLGGKATFLHRKAFNLVVGSNSGQHFSVRSLAAKHEVSLQQAQGFLSVLAADRFVQPAERG